VDERKLAQPEIFAWDSTSKVARMQFAGGSEDDLPGVEGKLADIWREFNGYDSVNLAFDLGPGNENGQRAEVTVTKGWGDGAYNAYLAFFKLRNGQMRLYRSLGPIAMQCIVVKSGY
jgi:hypothetical protein